MLKKIGIIAMCLLVMCSFMLFAMGSGESGTDDQGSGAAAEDGSGNNLGSYRVDILSCRLAKDYEGSDVVVVKYNYTNNSSESTSFDVAFMTYAYQNGIGLNGAYVLADNANYSDENQSKSIKSGASIEVEVAYKLNDTTTDVEIEVTEFISFSDKKVTKTFSIA